MNEIDWAVFDFARSMRGVPEGLTISRVEAERRVHHARYELGGILLAILRAGEHKVAFNDPRVQPALIAVKEAEIALASLGGEIPP
jgi:hypothetical protein